MRYNEQGQLVAVYVCKPGERPYPPAKPKN